MHVYHAGAGLPVATILRPAKTPDGLEVRTVIKHLTKRIQTTWTRANIFWRGDSHYGRSEAMNWCDDNSVGYIFGLAGNSALDRELVKISQQLRFWHSFTRRPSPGAYPPFQSPQKSVDFLRLL